MNTLLNSDLCKICNKTASELACCWFLDHFSGEAGQESKGRRG